MAYSNTKLFDLIFGVDGVPADTQYVVPGYAATQVTPISETVPYTCRLVEARVRCRLAPGGIVVDTYTVGINGAGSACAPTVTGAAVDGTWSGDIAVAADSEIEIVFTTSGATAADDIQIRLEFRIFI